MECDVIDGVDVIAPGFPGRGPRVLVRRVAEGSRAERARVEAEDEMLQTHNSQIQVLNSRVRVQVPSSTSQEIGGKSISKMN